MDLCEHITGYSLALEYFPNLFTKHLKFKYDYELEKKISKKLEKFRGNDNIEYEDLLLAINYIKYLHSMKDTFDNIKDISIKSLYLRYDDIVVSGDNRGDGYNYLFLLSILRVPVLQILRSMDSRISSFPKDKKSKDIQSFVSKWNQLFSSDYKDYNYKDYNYINMSIFIGELSFVSRDNPILMGYNNILDEALIQIDSNANILKKK